MVGKKDVELAARLVNTPLILIGGAALPFYGVERGTVDIDFEIQTDSVELIASANEKLEAAGISADASGDINGWGQIPLPEGYRSRIIATDIEHVSVLNPLDYIYSKLRRGTGQDVEDCLAVSKAQKVPKDEIEQHRSLVKLPADPLSLQFNRAVDAFLDLLS